MAPAGPVGGEKTPPANPDEAGAHEVSRARRATVDAGDPACGGRVPVGARPRGFHHGRGGGPGWSVMRYYLGPAVSEGRLAGGIAQAAGPRVAVPHRGPAQALQAGLGRAAVAAIDPAAVAPRADEALGPATRADIEPETKLGQAVGQGGWTKAPNDPTLGRVVAQPTAFGALASRIRRGATFMARPTLTRPGRARER